MCGSNDTKGEEKVVHIGPDGEEFATFQELFDHWKAQDKARFQALPLHKKVWEVFHNHIVDRVVEWYNWLYFYVRSLYQKCRYGFADHEVWCLDRTIAAFALPRLIKFRAQTNGWDDYTFKTFEEWQETLDKMIFALTVVKDGVWGWSDTQEEYETMSAKVQEGLDLFGKHMWRLWY